MAQVNGSNADTCPPCAVQYDLDQVQEAAQALDRVDRDDACTERVTPGAKACRGRVWRCDGAVVELVVGVMVIEDGNATLGELRAGAWT